MKKVITFIIFIFLINASANAQLILGIANYKYNGMNYMEAIPYYKYLYSKDSNDVFVLGRLANSYRLTKQSSEAEALYAKLLKHDSSSSVKFYYANSLLENGNFEQAYDFISKPDVYRNADDKLLAFHKTYTSLNKLKLDAKNVSISRLNFNNKESDFAPSIYKNGIIFASSRLSSTIIQRSHGWTDKLFVTMYVSSNEDGFSSVKAFAPYLKEKFNYGPGAFDAKNQILYYSINNPNKKSKKGVKDLKINVARYNENKDNWIDINNFPYNSSEYANTHPSISQDGKYLYFSSNMPGGFGGMDIYMVERYGDTAWSTPKNLGARINTSADEVFPFIYADDQLFFASNGRGGLGGLDVYVNYLKDTMHISENLGEPVNSRYDDFGFVLFPKNENGFFSSNRLSGGLDDDIYSYKRNKPRMKDIKFVIIDSLTKNKIYNSQLSLFVNNFPDKEEVHVLKNAELRHDVVPNAEYLIEANAFGYFNKSISKVFTWADTIYIVELKKQSQYCILKGQITELQSKSIIDSANVQLLDKKTKELIASTNSDKYGFYTFTDIKPFKEYIIQVTKAGYFSSSKTLTTAKCIKVQGTDYDYKVDIQLEQIILGKAIKIENIYFDLNKYNIRKDAAKELDKIVKMLNDNPEIIIELSSHTDSRGSDASNLKLSDNRAKSSAQYIISKGISKDRITGKGYGETKLVNECGNDVKCPEKLHQQNRRTEFSVVGFLK